jgi:hypothetical protein
MGLPRFRGGRKNPRLHNNVAHIGGSPLWVKCECGKWISRETGEHVELVVLSLEEFMKRYEQKCPDRKSP